MSANTKITLIDLTPKHSAALKRAITYRIDYERNLAPNTRKQSTLSRRIARCSILGTPISMEMCPAISHIPSLKSRQCSEPCCKDIYVYPNGRNQIFKLSELQIQSCGRVPLPESIQDQDAPEGFRFRAEIYALRVDPYEFMSLSNFRNRYERNVSEMRSVRGMRRVENDPEFMEAFKAFC
ncbi:hypothetical protein BDY21DRAFT_363856 [Lineolata rhizophorae]|uniref:Uncharacterized protein n=1 Tax=Lineolata rhizophorae TaxID=578093 RepID=A0A6A6P123_9PEZI|nr:hypothetical protein BDY21DRAFT_363856 [Lineolata rhizophorae]